MELDLEKGNKRARGRINLTTTRETSLIKINAWVIYQKMLRDKTSFAEENKSMII